MSIHRVVVSGTMYAQLWQCRFYVNNIDGALSDEEICGYFDTHWVENMRPPTINDVKFNSISSAAVGPPAGAGFTLPLAKAGGGFSSNQVPTFMAWVFQLRTAFAGRKFRGRWYMPGVTLGLWTEGRINAAGLANWNQPLINLNNAFIQGNQNGQLNLVVHGEPEAHDTPVTAIQIRSILGVQRRRNIGVGS